MKCAYPIKEIEGMMTDPNLTNITNKLLETNTPIEWLHEEIMPKLKIWLKELNRATPTQEKLNQIKKKIEP